MKYEGTFKRDDLTFMNKEDIKLYERRKEPPKLLTPVRGLIKKVSGEEILEIDIETKTPVQKLYFNGNIPIRAGDEINAYVLKCKFQKFKGIVQTQMRNPRTSNTTWFTGVLVEGNYKKKMDALKIEILEKGKISRETLAENYEEEMEQDSLQTHDLFK